MRLVWRRRCARMVHKIRSGKRTDLTWEQVILGYLILEKYHSGEAIWHACQIFSSEIDESLVDRINLIWEEASAARWSQRPSNFHAGRNNWLLWLLRPESAQSTGVDHVLVEMTDELFPVPGIYIWRSLR